MSSESSGGRVPSEWFSTLCSRSSEKGVGVESSWIVPSAKMPSSGRGSGTGTLHCLHKTAVSKHAPWILSLSLSLSRSCLVSSLSCMPLDVSVISRAQVLQVPCTPIKELQRLVEVNIDFPLATIAKWHPAQTQKSHV